MLMEKTGGGKVRDVSVHFGVLGVKAREKEFACLRVNRVRFRKNARQEKKTIATRGAFALGEPQRKKGRPQKIRHVLKGGAQKELKMIRA